MKLILFVFLFTFQSEFSWGQVNFPIEPTPAPLAVLNAGNASNFKLSGYCQGGGGDVFIEIGTLNFTVPCMRTLGIYLSLEDVSAETITNPIQQCITQGAFARTCSRYTDNTLAPANIIFESVLADITASNESNYTIQGSCAPSGALISVDVGGQIGILSGQCNNSNQFVVSGDMSVVADGLNVPVVFSINDGVNPPTVVNQTVNKLIDGIDIALTHSYGPTLDIVTASAGMAFDVVYTSPAVTITPTLLAGDITITGGTGASVSNVNCVTNICTVTLSGVSGSGDLEISIPTGTATDSDGRFAFSLSTTLVTQVINIDLTVNVTNAGDAFFGQNAQFTINVTNGSGVGLSYTPIISDGSFIGGSVPCTVNPCTVMVENAGLGALTLTVPPGLISDSLGNTGPISSEASSLNIIPDPPPTVSGLVTTANDGDGDFWIEPGESLEFTVTFNEPVFVSGGTPDLELSFASGVKNASYSSGTGSASLTFTLPITNGDVQCDGNLSVVQINLNGAAIEDSGANPADFSALPGSTSTLNIDGVAPQFTGVMDISLFDATLASANSLDWSGTLRTDTCGLNDLEIALGTTSGGQEEILFTSVPGPAQVAEAYTIQDGIDGFTVNLVAATDYFHTLRLSDQAGNTTSLSSVAWQLSPVQYIPNIAVSVSGLIEDSVIDNLGNTSSDPGFTGVVDQWLDLSGSAVNHDFQDVSGNRPLFTIANHELQFDGVNDCLNTVNSNEVNLQTQDQRAFSLFFRTGANVTAPQMIYEEGGSIRGMSLYIDSGLLYCAYWNAVDDGDGTQPLVFQSAVVTPNTLYDISSVFDYSSYTGPAGPDGTFECFLNGSSMGAQIPITSRLFPHAGDIRLGCNGSTLLHTGNPGSNNMYFGGNILEFMLFNSPPSSTEALDISDYLRGKWSL